MWVTGTDASPQVGAKLSTQMNYLNPPPGSYDIDVGFRLTHQQIAKDIKMPKASDIPEKRGSSPGPGTYNPKSRLRCFKTNPRIA